MSQVYGFLRREVLEGRLAPGEAISEASVAARLGVSRTPVRQALARLRVEGLVEAGGRSLRVIQPRWEDFQNYLECRAALEHVVARSAALHAREADIEVMRGALVSAERCSREGDVVGLIRANTTFHETMVLSTGNRPLGHLLDSIRGPILVFRSAVLHYGAETDEIIREHRLILERIAERDAEGAVAAMEGHLRNDWRRGRQAVEACSTSRT